MGKARPCSSSAMVSRVRLHHPHLIPFCRHSSFIATLLISHPHFPLHIVFLSDLSAAQHADVLFVKVTGIDEKDNLKKHCDKAGIPYIPFLDFHVAKAIVGQIVRGEKTREEFLVKPTGAAN